MTDTTTLIEQLAARGKPVQRLASPLRRALSWIGLAIAIIAAVVAIYGFRAGLVQTLETPAVAEHHEPDRADDQRRDERASFEVHPSKRSSYRPRITAVRRDRSGRDPSGAGHGQTLG